jgi:dTDP-D-glucose 4,6-dehydratase
MLHSASQAAATAVVPALAPRPFAPKLLITGGAGFVLSHVVRTWLDRHPAGSCVIFDKLGLQDGDASRFFAPLLASGRLAVFTGDVGGEASWARLANVHGTDFTHVVAGAAITPTADEEAALGIDILRIPESL